MIYFSYFLIVFFNICVTRKFAINIYLYFLPFVEDVVSYLGLNLALVAPIRIILVILIMYSLYQMWPEIKKEIRSLRS